LSDRIVLKIIPPTGAVDIVERSYLLLLRYVLLNVSAIGIIAAVWFQGWVGKVFAGDVTKLSLVIAAVFLVGWVLCSLKVVRCSNELNAIRGDKSLTQSRMQWYRELTTEAANESRAAIADCLRSRLYSRISAVRLISNNLILLGLIGTVIGFIIALSGVDEGSVADVGSVGPMVSTLIQGMSVALYTTLVGAVLHVWLTLCYQVLATGTVNLANAVIERTEAPNFHATALDS
jgi:hypothetical protein